MTPSQQNRLSEKLRDYWQSLRGSRPYPDEREVEPSFIKDDWDSCFLVKKTPAHEGYRYEYLGKELIAAFGGDVTHKEISDKLIDPASKALVKSFASTVSTGKPVEDEGEFTNTQGVVVKYRSCMLPLGDGKGSVGYILGGMKWKSF